MVYPKQEMPVNGFLDERTLVVIPRLTQIAYSEHSFYDYYTGKCDESCLTQPLNRTDKNYYISGLYGFTQLNDNYSTRQDIEIDKNPDLVKQYDTLIILHEEYATQKIYDAITNHPHVIYLYPNTFYALVSTDYASNTMSLVKGHDYKQQFGFNWKYENTNLETKPCIKGEWKFYDINNGKMLDCYPEIIIKTDQSMRLAVQKLVQTFNNSGI